MNITDIIREEHELCQERIAERVADLLMGGVTGAPAPRALPPRVYQPATKTPITLTRNSGMVGTGHNAVVARQTRDDYDSVLAFIADNPGCYGPDIIQHMGCENGNDRRYINVTKRMRKDERVMTRGSMRQQVYYINDKAPAQQSFSAPPSNKGVGRGRSRNPAPKIKDPEARDDKLVAYVKKYPGTTSPELRDHFAGKPEMGTKEALMSAIHRLCVKGRLKKKQTNKLGHRGAPVVELRAVK